MSDVAAAPLRVLIVDDAADLRLLVRYVLQLDPAFTVIGEAEDGHDSIRKATELQPDLVLLDLSMPGLDGLEALPLILAAAPDVRVIVLSGFSAKAMAARAVDGGALGYVEKGAPPADLLHQLRTLLQIVEPAGQTTR